MNSKIDHSKHAAFSGGDLVKYVIASVLVVAGLFVWFWFSTPDRAIQLGSWAPQLRGLAVVLGLVAGGLLFLVTGKGRETRSFLAEARFELRKVVWPTRQEAFRTTWVVAIVVTILSLILFGFDLIIQWAVQWLLSFGR